MRDIGITLPQQEQTPLAAQQAALHAMQLKMLPIVN